MAARFMWVPTFCNGCGAQGVPVNWIRFPEEDGNFDGEYFGGEYCRPCFDGIKASWNVADDGEWVFGDFDEKTSEGIPVNEAEYQRLKNMPPQPL